MVVDAVVSPTVLRSSPRQRSNSAIFREELLLDARIIAESIFESRLRARDGSLTWQRPNRSTQEGAPATVAAGPHLYEGLPGIAVLFAALWRAESRDEHRDLSLEIIAPLRALLGRLADDPERARSMRLGIGGLVGLGSFVYALVTLGRLLAIPELFDEAHRVCGLIAPEHIAGDRALDVVSGAPGAILALLLLDRHRPGPTASGETPLEVASRCADHLLAQRVERKDGTTAWATDPRFPPLTGFAHGSAGICCALLKLYASTGREELRATALRGWAFERSTYSEEHGDWIDPTSPTLRFLNQWCFGAPGIALARLATLEVQGGEAVEAEIRHGLRITTGPALSTMEHICCGDFGRVDVLIYAAETLRRPELREAAGEIACRSLAKARGKGRFDGLVRSPHRDPSLFSGEAGISYTLLRLAYPGELPCLLAME